jgi:hypothetical protein
MRTRNIFPFNTVIIADHAVSLIKALEWGRRQAAIQGGSPVKLAKLYRQRVIDKPRGRLGYTFREWSRSFKTGGPAFHQGR